jgi:hypothetical protein
LNATWLCELGPPWTEQISGARISTGGRRRGAVETTVDAAAVIAGPLDELGLDKTR